MTVTVMMGIAGSGKSTVGKAFAARRGLPFLEGDDCHPVANVVKMRAGLPLDDGDRAPWLAAIADWIDARDGDAVASCSALKRSYRDRLRAACDGCLRFVLLDIAADAARRRIAHRPHHFMPATLVDSQMEALEYPVREADVLVIDALRPVDAIVAEISVWLGDGSEIL